MELIAINPEEFAASILETDKELVVRWNLLGCRRIKVYLEKQVLFLSCYIDYLEEKEDMRLSYTGFLRQKLTLPVSVKENSTHTVYAAGVIEVTLKKS